MRDTPDVGALALFVDAVRDGSISAAARRSGVTQQTASARLRGLEQRLGLELLLRTPQGVTTTPVGETVAIWAEEVLAAADRFGTGIALLRSERRRALTVAASQTVAAHLLPGWLVALRDHHVRAGQEPTAVSMRAANSVEVAELVRSGAVDLGFIESTALPSGLAHTVVATDALAVVVAPTDPWAGREVSLAELAATPLVAREEGSGTRQAWEDAVRARLRAAPAAPAAVLSTTAAVRSAVAEGLGAAVLSALAVADDIRLGRLALVRLAAEPITRPITALWRGGRGDLGATSRELLGVAAAAAPVS